MSPLLLWVTNPIPQQYIFYVPQLMLSLLLLFQNKTFQNIVWLENWSIKKSLDKIFDNVILSYRVTILVV